MTSPTGMMSRHSNSSSKRNNATSSSNNSSRRRNSTTSSSIRMNTIGSAICKAVVKLPLLLLLSLYLQSFSLSPANLHYNNNSNNAIHRQLTSTNSSDYSSSSSIIPAHSSSYKMSSYFFWDASGGGRLSIVPLLGVLLSRGPPHTTQGRVVASSGGLFAAAADYEYDPSDYDYDYGDPNFHYEDRGSAQPRTSSSPTGGVAFPVVLTGSPPPAVLPLCCPPGSVFDHIRCVPATPPAGAAEGAVGGGGSWQPALDAAPAALFEYTDGFPRCGSHQPVELHQSDVFFQNTSLFLPTYVQMSPVGHRDYCITRVTPSSILHAPGGGPAPCTHPSITTKVYVCVVDRTATPSSGGVWLLIACAHLLLAATVVAYCVLPDLRAVEGQYMICFVLSLLLYNVCLFPVSTILMEISEVSCIALKAVKYFFFCGVFLWFSVMCFDVWRTVRSCCDLTGRRRFVLYSLYTWLMGAVMTTGVLVLDILTSGSTAAAGEEPLCQLKLPVHVVLQLFQGAAMLVSAVFVLLAVRGMNGYSKLGAGLPRSDATLCVKQTAKLFLVMLFHSLLNASHEVIQVTVIQLWQFVVLESVSIFGIFVYRRSILKQIYAKLCSTFPCCQSQNSAAVTKGAVKGGVSGGVLVHHHQNGGNGGAGYGGAEEKIMLASVSSV